MNYDESRYDLSQLADHLGDLAAVNDLPDEPRYCIPGEMLRQAAMLVESANDELKKRTATAVAEVIQIAARRKGAIGPIESQVSLRVGRREKATV